MTAIVTIMPLEASLTLAVVALCVGLLASNHYPPDVVMLRGLTLLLLAGVITPADALSGLSNEGMVTVAVLYVVVSGLQETGVRCASRNPCWDGRERWRGRNCG